MPPLLRALRPWQWSKNFFVLAPLVFAHRLGAPSDLWRAALAFTAFSAAASAGYLVNDVRDRRRDRLHPVKCHRPIAAGIVSVGKAVGTAGLLTAAALAAAALLGPRFAITLVAYLAVTSGYSWKLKEVVIVDVMTLALGFVLRVLAGAAAIDVAVSKWILLCTGFLALFLGFSKRRHELLLLEEGASDRRAVLAHYSPLFLDQMINVVTASAIMSYALYAVAPETAARHHSGAMIYTVPFVLFGVFRYLYLTYQRPGARTPTEEILTDGPFVVNLASWALAIVAIIYR